MSRLNREQLRKMLLKEFKMLGMGNPGAMGIMGLPQHREEPHEHEVHMKPVAHAGGHEGSVSKEDCCKAVLCLIDCCECPETKQLLRECCEDILSTC